MSDALSIETPAPTRRSRASRPAREIVREEPVVEQTSVVTDEIDDTLAETQRRLEQATQQGNEQRRLAREEAARRQQAEQQLQQARVTQASDRESVVATALQAALADKERAGTAKRMAREAGDIEAELKADDDRASAVYRESQAQAELHWLKNQPKPEAQQQQRQAPKIDELSQRWLDEHPQYFANESYRNTAHAADASAQRAGLMPDPKGDGTGNPAYIQHVEAFMAKAYGDNGAQQVAQNGGGGRQHSGSALPPSRGSGGPNNSGFQTVETLLGPLQVKFDGRGQPVNIRFANKDQMDNFDEGAKLNSKLYAKDPQGALADYAKEHVLEAMEGFENFKVGEGKVYGRE
jgi:hypothetical protein